MNYFIPKFRVWFAVSDGRRTCDMHSVWTEQYFLNWLNLFALATEMAMDKRSSRRPLNELNEHVNHYTNNNKSTNVYIVN